jgi:hypothetical protein
VKFWKHPAMPVVLLVMLFVVLVVAIVAAVAALNQPRREAPVEIGHQVVNPAVPADPDAADSR